MSWKERERDRETGTALPSQAPASAMDTPGPAERRQGDFTPGVLVTSLQGNTSLDGLGLPVGNDATGVNDPRRRHGTPGQLRGPFAFAFSETLGTPVWSVS